MDEIVLLGGTCLGLAVWVIYLQRKLATANEFAGMAMMALRDVAEGKVQIVREDGQITIKVKKPVGNQ